MSCHAISRVLANFFVRVSETEAVYLDVHVYTGPRFAETGVLDMETYFKPTNSFLYVHATSEHPPSVFKAITKGKTIRYLRTTSSQSKYREYRVTLRSDLHDGDTTLNESN